MGSRRGCRRRSPGVPGAGAAKRGTGARRPPARSSAWRRRTIGSFVKATGVVKPRIGAEVRVGSRVSGVVARLHVRIGDTRHAAASCWPSWRRASSRRAATRRRRPSRPPRRRVQYARSDLDAQAALSAAALLSAAELDVAERARRVAEQQRGRGGREPRLRRAPSSATRGSRRPSPGSWPPWPPRRARRWRPASPRRRSSPSSTSTRLEVWAYVDETDIGRIADGPGGALHRGHVRRPGVRGARHRGLPAGGGPRQRRELRDGGDVRPAARPHAAARDDRDRADRARDARERAGGAAARGAPRGRARRSCVDRRAARSAG